MEWLSDITEGMNLNFMSYAKGYFYVKTVELASGITRYDLSNSRLDSRGIAGESCGGSALPLWVMFTTMEHLATDFTAQNTSYFLCLWRVAAGDLCLKRQVSRDFLCKNSGQGRMRFLFTAAAKNCFLHSGPGDEIH